MFRITRLYKIIVSLLENNIKENLLIHKRLNNKIDTKILPKN